MTYEEIEALLARIVATQAEAAKAQAEARIEAEKQNAEIRAHNAETARMLKESERESRQLKKQLGELGNKFGSFTEGMAYKSICHILERQFNAAVFSRGARAHKNGHTMEIDVLGFSAEAVYVVETKSELDEEGIQKLLKRLTQLTDFFPDFEGKEVYGVVAAVDLRDHIAERARNLGLYVARVSRKTFRLDMPAGFQPKSFARHNGRRNGASGSKK